MFLQDTLFNKYFIWNHIAYKQSGLPLSLKILESTGIWRRNFQALESSWTWVVVLQNPGTGKIFLSLFSKMIKICCQLTYFWYNSTVKQKLRPCKAWFLKFVLKEKCVISIQDLVDRAWKDPGKSCKSSWISHQVI